MVGIPDNWYMNKALTALKLIWIAIPALYVLGWILNVVSFEITVITLLAWYYGDDTVVIERS